MNEPHPMSAIALAWGNDGAVERKILKAEPRECKWSSEDLATYRQWRRWVSIIYGGIAAAAIAAGTVLHFVSGE